PLADNKLAFLQSVRYDRDRRRRLTLLNAADLRLVLVIDNVDIVALLVRQHGSARDRQNLDRLHPPQQHGYKFAVGQLTRARLPRFHAREERVRNDTTQGNCVGVFGDRWRHIVEVAFRAVDPAVGKAQLYQDCAVAALAGVAGPQIEPCAQRNWEQHVHRILTDDVGQDPGCRRDDVAFSDLRRANLTVNGSADLGIGEIDL